MGSRGGFTMTGLDGFKRAIDKFPEESVKAMRGVARDAALRVKARARSLVAVDTGITRDSIDVQPQPDLKQYRVSVFASPPHVRKGRNTRTAYLPNLALWLEFGTTKKAARPFLRPALDAEGERYKREMQAAADAMLKQLFK